MTLWWWLKMEKMDKAERCKFRCFKKQQNTMEITKKIQVECLRNSKLKNPQTKIEREYNDYLTDKIFWIQLDRFKSKKIKKRLAK